MGSIYDDNQGQYIFENLVKETKFVCLIQCLHDCFPGLVRKARVHRTTFHRALLVQRNNIVVIWMVIPLFTFHFFGRVIVCVRYGINYAQKQRLGGKKNNTFL